YSIFTIAIVAAPRLLLRMTGRSYPQRRPADEERRVLIAGAGEAGQMVVREILANPQLGLIPAGFIDDDLSKLGLRLGNMRVLGTLKELKSIADKERVQELIIAMPRAPGTAVRRVVRAAYDAGLRTRTVPGLFEIL